MKKKCDTKTLLLQLKNAKAQLKIYRWLCDARGSYREQDRFLKEFMDLLVKTMNAEAGSILIKNRNKLYFKAAKGESAEALKKITIYSNEGIAGWVAKTGKSVIVSNVKKDSHFNPGVDAVTGFKTRSVIAVPLKVRDKIIGAVELLNPVSGSFSKDSKDMLASIAGHLGIAMENVRLTEETKRRFSEMNTLFDVSRIITSSLAQESLLGSIMKSAIEMLGVEAVSLLLADEGADELVFKVALGEKGGQIKELRVPVDNDSIAGWVAKKGTPLIVNNVEKDERWNPEYSRRIGFDTKSILAVPLKIGERIVGVAEAINKAGDTIFTRSDQELFMTVANQIAMATENSKLNEDLRDLFFSTVQSLVNTIEAKDTYTAGHSERVTRYSLLITDVLKLSQEEKSVVRLAGLLHDIGKIGIIEGILKKDESLNDEDWKMIRQHPVIGAKILEPVKQMASLIPCIRHHHERYDGRGYPDGIKGNDIPLYARIIAIGDTFDAMTSDRSYRKGLPVEVSLHEIEKNKGSQFDPYLAGLFIDIYNEKG